MISEERFHSAFSLKVMQEVLHPYLDSFVVCYLDDVLVFSESVKEHMEHLRKVLIEIRKACLLCSSQKCEFFFEEIEFFRAHY